MHRDVWMLIVWLLTQSRIMDSLLYYCLHYCSLKAGSPTELFWLGLLASISWDLPVCPQFGVGARDLNSGYYACLRSTFPTELSPQTSCVTI